jgi:hypothetical protein
MDRRLLLKSLAALQPGCLGALLDATTEAEVDLDALLSAATEAEIERAWQLLESSPIRFKVSEGGALSIADMADPVCRADCLCLAISNRPSATEIIDLAAQEWDARRILAQSCLGSDDVDGDPELAELDVLSDWLNESEENVRYAGDKLRRWLSDTDLDEDDYAAAYRNGNTSQAAALHFWRDGKLDRHTFGVVIIGGGPGNDFSDAELRLPLDEAIAAANALGVPIRFEGFNPTRRIDPAPLLDREKPTTFIKPRYWRPWHDLSRIGRPIDDTAKRPAEHRWRAVDIHTERGTLCVVTGGKDVAPGVSAGHIVRFVRAPIPGTAVAVFQYAPGVYAFSDSDGLWVGKDNAHYCFLIDRTRLRLLEPWDLENNSESLLLLNDIMQLQEQKEPALAAKQARLFQILATSREQ